MQHLFIINPIATRVRGKARELTDEIESFFRKLGMDNYHIYPTEWARDGMGYAFDFARASPELVRIHVMGGAGTLYEIVNGVIGLPNVQIAAYPMGVSNHVIRYFGSGREHLFRSLDNQVFSNTTPIDAIRCENGYALGFSAIGLEAVTDNDGTKILERRPYLPIDPTYIYTAAKAILKISTISQHYNIVIDGADHSGAYASMLIAGGPCYSSDLAPAKEAHPNDGILDIYMLKTRPPLKLLSMISAYTSGRREKYEEEIVYTRGKSIAICGEKDFIVSLDGDTSYERRLSYEVIPDAVDFVCPDVIDVRKLPRIYEKRRRKETAHDAQ